MDQEISVYVNAKIADLNKQMAEGARSVENFAVSADGSLVMFGKSLTTLEGKLKGFQSALKQTVNPQEIIRLNQLIAGSQVRINAINSLGAKSYDKLAKSTLNAAQAGTNLGRVVQDLPYGIQGVQNNIVPLVESLGGGAGLSLAFSLAAAAATFWVMATDKAGRAAKVAAKDNIAYVDTLDAVTGAQLKGAEAALKDQTNVNLLFGAYQNANLPLRARKEAYKELQDLYPAYFENLKFENTATVKQKNAYEELTKVILASAQARAASDLITVNTTRQLEDKQRIIDLNKEEIELAIELGRLQYLERIRDKRAVSGLGSGGTDQSARNTIALEEKITKNKSDQRNLATDMIRLNERNALLVEEVYKNMAKGATLTSNIGAKGDVTDKLARNFLVADKINNEIYKRFADGVLIKTQQALKNKTANIDPSFKFPLDQIFDIDPVFSEFERFAEYVQYEVFPGLEAGFANFFNTILTDGKISFNQLANSILSEFSRIVSSAVAKKLFGLLTNLLTGGSSGALSAGSGFLGRLLGFAGGTHNAPGGWSMVGENGPELVNLPRGSSVIPNGQFGGSTVIVLDSIVRGNNIVIAASRSVKRTNRVN